uniref:NudC domain-containing protein 3 n=1 Tax=Cacopsylla melanoneura TaxID=428564 RepID=A0A8D8WQ03_9HEMI
MESRENNSYDEFLMNILCSEQSIPDFLNIVFGFLYRRTDLFVEQSSPGQKFGYPPGQCEKLIYDSMKYFQQNARERNQSGKEMQLFDQVVENEEVIMDSDIYVTDDIPSLKDIQGATNELDVSKNIESLSITSSVKCASVALPRATQRSDTVASSQTPMFIKRSSQSESTSSSCYNGADLETYAWSQNITDLDVEVRVADSVNKSRLVQVNVSTDKIDVTVDGHVQLSGQLAHNVKKDETVWTLTPGKYIQIHLEKAKERWWDQLIQGEPKIDLKAIDSTRPFSELAQDEQMKVNELIWNDYQKSKGLPSSEQIKSAKILKKAWTAEGSPFKGREFDPSIIHPQ